MAVKVEGIDKLTKRMSVLGGDVNLAGRNELRRAARDMRDLARDYAPVEYRNLELAIQTLEEHLGPNRWTQTLFIEESDIAPERGMRNGRPVKVGDYARYAHQGIPGGIGQGARSQEKAARLGVRVGPRFIKRAYDDLKRPVYDRIKKAIADATERKIAKAPPPERGAAGVARSIQKTKPKAKTNRDKTRKAAKTPKRRGKRRGKKK
jgi:hypothetical protein